MKFPKRRSLSIKNILNITLYLTKSFISGDDPGYQGKPYKSYCKKLEKYYKVKHAIPVCSGTNAIYLALKSLDLKENQFVYVSPISDPGTYSAICENNYKIKILDSKKLLGNASPESLDKIAVNDSGAILLVHHAGWYADIEGFRKLSTKYNLTLIQDFSQCHGFVQANVKNMLPNEIAVFSTMYRKSQSSGGSGGFITTNCDYHGNLIRSLSDRGKFIDASGKWLSTSRNGNEILLPSLNHSLDDISCLMGVQSLKKLDRTIKKRREFTFLLHEKFKDLTQWIFIPKPKESTSPFIVPISLMNCNHEIVKKKFSEYLFSFNIPHNSNYKFLASEWTWLKPYVNYSQSENAKDYLNRTIFLYVNERYTSHHASFIHQKIKMFFQKSS
tara:strand:+ start:95 stop:1255 length:1161 start_codon:yes stop_codon:yes gene_type:complete